MKEINLFLQAHVSPGFLSLAPSSFPLCDPVSPFFNVSVDGALSRLPPRLPPFPLSLPFPLFIRRAGSGVTNYTERAEKVVWVLPSGLPSWIIIREVAGTQQPLVLAAPQPRSQHQAAWPQPGSNPPHASLAIWLQIIPPSLIKRLGLTSVYV